MHEQGSYITFATLLYYEAFCVLLSKVRQATFPGGDGAGGSLESTFSSYDEKLL